MPIDDRRTKELADQEDKRVLEELNKLSGKTGTEAAKDFGVNDADMTTPKEPVDPFASPVPGVDVGEGVMPVLQAQEETLTAHEEKILKIGKRTETAFLAFVQPEGPNGPEHPVSVMTRQGLMPLMCFSEDQLPMLEQNAQQVADNSGVTVIVRRFSANIETTGDIVIERRLVKVAAGDAMNLRGADKLGMIGGGRKIGG